MVYDGRVKKTVEVMTRTEELQLECQQEQK